MKMICVVGFLLTSTTVAAAGEFYLVQDSSTKQCTIVGSPPTTTQLVSLDDGKVFRDQDEAKRALGSLTSCSSRVASAVPTLPDQEKDSQTIKPKSRTAPKGRTATSATTATA